MGMFGLNESAPPNMPGTGGTMSGCSGCHSRDDEIDRLHAERNRDALDGQATMDEANNEIVRLKAVIATHTGEIMSADTAIEYHEDRKQLHGEIAELKANVLLLKIEGTAGMYRVERALRKNACSERDKAIAIILKLYEDAEEHTWVKSFIRYGCPKEWLEKKQ